jgi:hypothetical protein
MKFANGIPDTVEANMPLLDELGSPKTYNHYPNGWAMAFNTPFKMWKRCEFNGGTSDPYIVSWPAGIKSKGEIRDQYHHAIGLVQRFWTPSDPTRSRATSKARTAEVPESQAVNVRTPFVLDRRARRDPGSRHRGRALRARVTVRRPCGVFEGQPAPLRLQLRRDVRSEGRWDRDVPTGENLILSASFDKSGDDPPGVATGLLSLRQGDKKVGEGPIKTGSGASGWRLARAHVRTRRGRACGVKQGRPPAVPQ